MISAAVIARDSLPAIVRRPAMSRLPRMIPPVSRRDRILRAASLMFGVDFSDLRSHRRTNLLTLARRYAVVRLTLECGLSRMEIGRVLNRDHTTIIHHLRCAGVIA